MAIDSQTTDTGLIVTPTASRRATTEPDGGGCNACPTTKSENPSCKCENTPFVRDPTHETLDS